MGTILIALLMALWPHSNAADSERSFRAQCDSDETAVQLKCMEMTAVVVIPIDSSRYLHDGKFYWECKHFQHDVKPQLDWTVGAATADELNCANLVSDGQPILHPKMVCQVEQATCPYVKDGETKKPYGIANTIKELTATIQERTEEIEGTMKDINQLQEAKKGQGFDEDSLQKLTEKLKEKQGEKKAIEATIEAIKDILVPLEGTKEEPDAISKALQMWAKSEKSKAEKLKKDTKVLQKASDLDQGKRIKIQKQREYLEEVDLRMKEETDGEAKKWIKLFWKLFQKLYGEKEGGGEEMGVGDIKFLMDFQSSRTPPKTSKDPKKLKEFMFKLLEEGNGRELWSLVARLAGGKYYWYWDVIRVWYYQDNTDGDEKKKNTKEKWEQIQHIVDENEIKRRVRQMEDVSGFKLGKIFEIFGVDFENTGEYKSVAVHLGTSLYNLPAIHPHSSVSYARSLDSDHPYRTPLFMFRGDHVGILLQNEVRWQKKSTIYPKLSPNEWEYLRDSPLVEEWRAVLSERGDLINPAEGVAEANVRDDANINMQSGMTSHILNEESIYSIMFEKHDLLSINGPSGNMDAMLDIILLFKDRDLFLAFWGLAQYLCNAPDHSLGEVLIASQNKLFRDKVFVDTWYPKKDVRPDEFLDDELEYRKWIEDIVTGINPDENSEGLKEKISSQRLTEWLHGALSEYVGTEIVTAGQEKMKREEKKEQRKKFKKSVQEFAKIEWNDVTAGQKATFRTKEGFESVLKAIMQGKVRSQDGKSISAEELERGLTTKR